MARVYEGEPVLARQGRSGRSSGSIYRLAGVDARRGDELEDVRDRPCCSSTSPGCFVVYAAAAAAGLHCRSIRRGWRRSRPTLAFNTAVSFATNTNWQSYGGETTLSYLTQMLGLTVQNFVSAATGMAVLVALIRGLRAADRARRSATSGSISTRGTLYILLPLSLVLALVLVSQGVVQTFDAVPDGRRCSQPIDGRRRQGRHRADARRWARPRRRSRSSSSAPTAAGSSTSTRRIRSRTRRRSRTSSRCWRSC